MPTGTEPAEAAIQAAAFEARVPVRWSDQDPNGHVNNAKVVTIIEEARILWLNHRAMDEGLSSFRVPKVVASLRVDYSASVTAEEDVTVSIWTERMGRTSFVLGYRGAQNGRQVFTASTVLVMLDPSTGSPRELTRAERDYLGRPLPART